MANPRKYKIDPGLLFTSLLSLAFFAVFFAISVIRYNTFQYHDWDFALNANAMWNIVHGHPYISIYGRAFLGNHFNIIAFLIAPIYFLFKTPLTLLFLKTLALSFVSIPVYLIARRTFNSLASACFACIYFAYPALLYVLLYEFHFEDFAPLFLAFSFYFLIVNKKIWVFLFAALALMCKENVPLIVAAMGLYACLFRPHRRLMGTALFMAASLYFLLVTLYFQPIFTPSAGGAGYAHHYSSYGNGFLNIFLFILTHPLTIIKDICSQKLNLLLCVDVFSPLLYLPLLRLDVLFIILPTFLKNMLSRDWTTHTIYWHYAATMIPFIIISLIFAFKKLIKFNIIKRYLLFFLAAILFVELLKGYNLYQASHYFVKFHLKPTFEDAAKARAASLVEPDKSVITTFDFLPALSQRKDIYTFYMLWKHGPRYKEIPQTDYALIDFNDYFVEKFFNFSPERIFATLKNYTCSKDWGALYAKGDIVLFKKGFAGGETPLELLPLTGPEKKKAPFLAVDNSLELLDFAVKPGDDGHTLRLTFFWRAREKTASLYKILFFASGGKREFIFAAHSVGYKFFTPALNKNEVLKENYSLILPANNAKYDYSFVFLNISERKLAEISPSSAAAVDKHNRVIIKIP